MKKIALLAFCCACLSLSAQAGITSRVANLDAPEGETEALLMLEDEGRILRADARDDSLMAALRASAENGDVLRFDVDGGEVRGVELVGRDVAPAAGVAEEKSAQFNSEITVLASPAAAEELNMTLDRATKWRSQCYNRAHGWAYDMWRTRGVVSGKMFIFFSAKYIRQYKYDWWFHVAPYVYVDVDGEKVEYILDREYMRVPRPRRGWTDYFMYNDAECREVSVYSHYRNRQESAWCFLMPKSMYFRQPLDIKAEEDTGVVKTSFQMWEVRQARRQAFKNWRRYNP